MPEHDRRLKELLSKVKEHVKSAGKPKKILLQLPTGLRGRSTEISEAIGKELGCEVLLAGNNCYGACDLPVEEARQSGADIIVHVGHRPFYRKIETPAPVVYYDWPMDVRLDEKKLLDELLKMKEKRIGLISSVQFLHILPAIKSFLESQGKQAEIGGYVLGCWTNAADKLKGKVDALLFVGSGRFHPYGFECTYCLDLEKHELVDIRGELAKFEKLRWGRIMKAKDARTFGILVTSKPGQHELIGRAEALKARLEAGGKKALILIMDEITESSLSNFDCDAFINTACPRIEDDRWSKPMINASDADKILEE
jgi:2-(3-amino-3-carboxypropyl)histidine synthase